MRPCVSARGGAGYISAVSTKFTPAATARSSCACASASLFCSPHVIVPRQTSETTRSVPGKVVRFIGLLFEFQGRHETRMALARLKRRVHRLPARAIERRRRQLMAQPVAPTRFRNSARWQSRARRAAAKSAAWHRARRGLRDALQRSSDATTMRSAARRSAGIRRHVASPDLGGNRAGFGGPARRPHRGVRRRRRHGRRRLRTAQSKTPTPAASARRPGRADRSHPTATRGRCATILTSRQRERDRVARRRYRRSSRAARRRRESRRQHPFT